MIDHTNFDDYNDYTMTRLDKFTHIKLREVMLYLLKERLELQNITCIGLLLDTLGYLIMEETKGDKKYIDMTLDNMFRTLKANMHRVADKDPKHRLK
jgi:hypothetical protein